LLPPVLVPPVLVPPVLGSPEFPFESLQPKMLHVRASAVSGNLARVLNAIAIFLHEETPSSGTRPKNAAATQTRAIETQA
jgi:hypothetical protein